MNDPRTTPEIDSPRSNYAQRRTAALVAEYIHAVSDRHRSRASAGHAGTGDARRNAASDVEAGEAPE
jgi:hypothetical protein